MKRQLTFPLTRRILNLPSLGFILLLINIGTANAFFPVSPEQLTLLAKNNQYYQTLCPTLSRASITAESKKIQPPFTLLNWNIYKQQKINWEITLKELMNGVDLITLQEAKLSPELIQLSHREQLFYLHNFAFKRDNIIYGVNTLSKIAPMSLCGSTYKEPWIWIPKTGIASTYSIEGSKFPLLLINIHGVNFTLTERPLHEQLAPYIRLIEKHKGPVIFSGDFNTWTDSRLRDVKKSIIKAGFSEAFFNQDKRLRVFGLPLDHIFFRGLSVIEAKSLETDASDHSPQLVTFDLAT